MQAFVKETGEREREAEKKRSRDNSIKYSDFFE